MTQHTGDGFLVLSCVDFATHTRLRRALVRAAIPVTSASGRRLPPADILAVHRRLLVDAELALLDTEKALATELTRDPRARDRCAAVRAHIFAHSVRNECRRRVCARVGRASASRVIPAVVAWRFAVMMIIRSVDMRIACAWACGFGVWVCGLRLSSFSCGHFRVGFTQSMRCVENSNSFSRAYV